MNKLHHFFLKTAFLLAENSKCVSHHVGAVIVKDERIVSMGYNGAPPGLPNCSDVFNKDNFDPIEHSKWSDANEIHAEMNALMFSVKNNVEVDGCDMFVTISPCNYCLKNISMSGIKNIYYLYKYDKSDLNPVMFQKVNIQEVSNALELKKWIEKNNLLYIPKQRQNISKK
jgi:dCMP deaminase